MPDAPPPVVAPREKQLPGVVISKTGIPQKAVPGTMAPHHGPTVPAVCKVPPGYPKEPTLVPKANAETQPPPDPFFPSQDFATMFRNTINEAQSVPAVKPPPPIRPVTERDVWVDTPGKAPPPVYRPGQASSSAGPNIGPVATTAGMFQPENINWGAPSQQHPCPTPERYSMATPPAAKGRAGSKRRVTYTRDGPLDATMSDRATIVSMKWLELIERMNPRDDIKMAMRWRVHEGKRRCRQRWQCQHQFRERAKR